MRAIHMNAVVKGLLNDTRSISKFSSLLPDSEREDFDLFIQKSFKGLMELKSGLRDNIKMDKVS